MLPSRIDCGFFIRQRFPGIIDASHNLMAISIQDLRSDMIALGKKSIQKKG